jgi:hypothetical protein
MNKKKAIDAIYRLVRTHQMLLTLVFGIILGLEMALL